MILTLLVAHQLNTSYLELVETQNTFTAAIDLDPHDVPFLARIDQNHDATLTEQEVMASRELFFTFAFGQLQAADTGTRCTWDRAQDKDSWDAALRLWHGEAHFTCPKPAAELTVYLGYLDQLSRSHRALVRVTTDGVLGPQTILKHGEALIDPRNVPTSKQAWRFLVLGAEHIATGWDHLAFILALLLGVTRLKDGIIALTAFTLAHSATLALAWLNLFTLPSRVVEPIIALSIVAVGIENLRTSRSLPLRTLMAFAFGLIHGMGFASALEDAHFAKHAIVLSLFAFNLGVELTQIALVVLAWPVTTRLGKARRIASILLACIGLVWAVQRVL